MSAECNDCGTDLRVDDLCYVCCAGRLCLAVQEFFTGEILMEHLEEAWKRYEREIRLDVFSDALRESGLSANAIEKGIRNVGD